jgi:hypothetical protein
VIDAREQASEQDALDRERPNIEVESSNGRTPVVIVSVAHLRAREGARAPV